jgi:threonine synthase
MQFRSTKSTDSLVSFKEAVLRCLPLDGGLYVPDKVMDVRQFFLCMDEKTEFSELVAAVTPTLLEGELNPVLAARVAQSTYNFEPELIPLDENISLLNLYQGPTGAYKDFGNAFLAAILEEFIKSPGRAVVLSAVRGDSGISISHSFMGRKGIYSVLVYPSGTVNGLDPSRFACNGGNIIPIQVKGTFDDCQRLVIKAIRSRDFAEHYGITSANTINVGRLLPQVFFYLYAFIKTKKYLSGDLAFSVPSGNFGNLIAGLYAWKFGLPVSGFIAAMNQNNAFGDYLNGGPFVPRTLVNTCAPALDVSAPSNYERLASFYQEAPAVMRNLAYPASIGDELILKTMENAWKKYHICIDPHAAVALAAAERVAASQEWSGHVHTVVLATGHPAKEADAVRRATGQDIPIPENILALQKSSRAIAVIPPDIEAFEGAIASCF